MVNGLIGPFRACRVCVCLFEVFNELPAVIGRTVIMGDKCTANRYGDRYIYNNYSQCNTFETNFPLCFHQFAGGSDSNKGKSKKWRKILQFPHISQCIHLKDKLGKSIN